MSKTGLTPIEEKKKDINDINESNKQNKWLLFGTSIISNLLIVFFVGVMGANFIYMTSAINKVDNQGISLLEKFLPTEESSYFPQNGPLKGGSMCSSSKEHSTNWSNLNNIGIGKKGGWPYSMYKNNEDGEHGITQKFKNWFSTSIADCYITNRSVLQKWLGLFSSDKEDKNIFSNETFQMFVVAPLMFLIFPLIIFFIYFSSWFSSFKSGWGFTLIGMFLLYSWFTTSTVSLIQCNQYLLTFVFFPLIADYKRIRKIIGCNVKGLSLLFGLLVCSSAFSYLDNTISITMFLVYLFLIIKSFW